MMELAAEKGAQLISGRAIELNISDGVVTGVDIIHNDSGKSETLRATHVILAAGAWSPSLLESLPISSTRAHSITIHPQPSVDIAPYVLFTEISLPGRRGLTVSPEIYARPGNEVYACGPGDDSFLPKNVDDVTIDEAACESIWKHVCGISPELRAGTVNKRQACFLPIVETGGGPIVGAASNIAQGLIIATGHTCWGICNAPGTAKALSELVMDGKIHFVYVTTFFKPPLVLPGSFLSLPPLLSFPFLCYTLTTRLSTRSTVQSHPELSFTHIDQLTGYEKDATSFTTWKHGASRCFVSPLQCGEALLYIWRSSA
ncbi:FAD dependent oxidoreductase [Lentinula edodes]|uniref:FAD dependent oxidoreductase n=1 Tax=Lentinula edodes TaxID=5353 RepID=A0A1Q3ET36_LENED|nr:FAD dependent oxidoreductase [Lentinula edodes]